MLHLVGRLRCWPGEVDCSKPRVRQPTFDVEILNFPFLSKVLMLVFVGLSVPLRRLRAEQGKYSFAAIGTIVEALAFNSVE
uniref:Uncharacterized protein n=1 Tax=Trichuris muris TaxID=70415 RepID=A0A5S6QN34_TRIMR